MRATYLVFLSLISFFGLSATLNSQAIDIGVAERVITLGDAVRPPMAVFVDSKDDKVRTLARRAFSLHGGYKLTNAQESEFKINLEPASGNSAVVTIGSGTPYVEQLRRTVNGSDQQNAILRACDVVVEATLQSKGFFAGKLAFVGKQRGVSELYTSDLLFTRVRPLTRDKSLLTGPKWSPEGSRIVYTTYYKSGAPDIYMIDLGTGRKFPIATFKGTNTGASFSPDGRRLAMTLSGTGNSEIYVSDTRGKNMRRLTTNKSLEASPSWSPDGRRIVYTSDAPGKPRIYVISSNGGAAQRVPTDISNYCSEPVWNPVKDNLIAFTIASGGGFQIAVYDFDTKKSTVLTKAGSSLEPAWLNDGRHIVFTRREGGRTRLMLLDTGNGKVSALHNPSFGDASSADFVY